MATNPGFGTWEVGTDLRKSEVERFGALPTATGGIARIAYARAREAGIEVDPLLKKAGLTHHQIENPTHPPHRSQSNQLFESHRTRPRR